MTGQRGIGAVYGTSRQHAFARWFRYPAGFSPEALQIAVEAADVRSGHRVIDPFCGSATIAFALPVNVAQVVGIEAHPLIAQLGALKLRPPPGHPDGLRRAARRFAADPVAGEADGETELLRRCFDAQTLDALVGLRDRLAAEPRSRWAAHLRWALLGTLRDVANVKVGWPYQRPGQSRRAPFDDPAARLVARADRIADDLETGPQPPRGRIIRGDARTPAAWRRSAYEGVFDACVTSPPYLNNYDYADATRIELFFLGRVTTWAQMCSTVRAGMVVATTQQSRRRAAQRALASLERAHPEVHARTMPILEALVTERRRRERGKEYDQVLPTYLADIARVLARLHQHSRPGARSAWVIGDSAPYGVHVDTPALVRDLAVSTGFGDASIEHVRSRGLRWRTNGTRHQVPLVEQLLIFTRP